MGKADGRLDFLGGQNMFEVFIQASAHVIGTNVTQYDMNLDIFWAGSAHLYTEGKVTRDQAIENFKKEVQDMYGITEK